MFEIGDTLREARIRRGLSIKDVEHGTKIRTKYLQALEDEDFEVIPGPTFVKGFMRTYAEFLGLDSDQLVDEYRSRFETQPDPHQIRPLETKGRPRTGSPRRQPNHVLVGIAALIAIIALLWFGWGRGSESAELDVESVVGDTTESTVEDSGGGTTQPLPGEEGGNTGEEDGALEQTAPETSAAPSTTVEVSAESNQDGDTQGPVELVARASGGRCWLLVRDGSESGEVLWTGTLEPGEEKSFSASGPIWMHVGSPAALEVSVNGEPAEVPEPYGAFLVTPAGVQRVS